MVSAPPWVGPGYFEGAIEAGHAAAQAPPLWGGGEGRKPAISLGELCRVPLFMVPKGTPVLERASQGFAAPIPHPAG
jgi:hypothetical protein